MDAVCVAVSANITRARSWPLLDIPRYRVINGRFRCSGSSTNRTFMLSLHHRRASQDTLLEHSYHTIPFVVHQL
jgi:hypothetical protein